MKGRNWYSEAIDITHGDTDFETLIVEIAKVHPKVVVDAYAKIYGATWQTRCVEVLRTGKKLEAIKLCRNLTGRTLLEAKHAVEALE